MRFIRANKVFNGVSFLMGAPVLVLNSENILKEIVQESQLPDVPLESFNGILCPGFVNTHCHLELSHLKELIPRHTGLMNFAKHIIVQRPNTSKETMEDCMAAADQEMWENGIVAVGDISNSADSFGVKRSSNIHYHTFIELIGLNPANADIVGKNGIALFDQLTKLKLAGSLAAHAPYSVSGELLDFILDFDEADNLSFTMHNQESREELKFFMGEKSQVDELYQFLNTNISYFKPSGRSSLQTLGPRLRQNPSILVHNTFSRLDDLAAVGSKNIYWCFCPLANLYIENALPDYSFFVKAKERLCLGTDSLASNSGLDLVAEANALLCNTGVFSLEDILRMMTFTGAKALGISEDFGELKIGKNAGLNLLEFTNEQLLFIKKIT